MRGFAFLIGFSLILIVYGCLSYYIGKRIFHWLKYMFPRLRGRIFTIVYGLVALTMILSFVPFPSPINAILNWIGAYWMGIFVYLLLYFVLADLIIGLLRVTRLLRRRISIYARFNISMAAIMLTVGTVGYGIYNAKQITTVSYDVQLDKQTDGLNIVLISDLHLGAVNSEDRLETIVTKINALQPDLVCIAGDLFNDDYNDIQDPDRAIALFQSLNTKYGVYASLGNHDGGSTFEQMLDFIDRSQIQLLNDDYVVIDDRFILLGRIDPSPIGGFGDLERGDVSELIASLDSSLPIIVMDHTPSKLDQYGNSVDLILSGHTHRGQLFPGSLITNAIYEVDYGQYQRNSESPHVIVSSGAGTWGMPMRVGTHNEIVQIQLH